MKLFFNINFKIYFCQIKWELKLHSKKKKETKIIKTKEPKLKDKYKIIFIGENKIGTKSSLINILAGEKFNPDIEAVWWLQHLKI